MTYTKYLFFLFLCLFLNACDDDKDEPQTGTERSETQAWIENTMRKRYYWKKEISDKPDYTADPESFFTSLLYKGGDGKTVNETHYYYSYIEKASDNTRGYIQADYTYGFEFTSVWFSQQNSPTNFIVALVLHVLPGTPAAEAGLKRGDWIMYMNNKLMTTDDEVKTLYGDAAKNLVVYQWEDGTGFVNHRAVSLGAARAIQDYSPIYLKEVITASNGKKVGYMIYDRFQVGKDDDDTLYDDELRQASNGLFSDVDEFVLDLRYNNGGRLSSTCLMCAILGHSTVLTARSLGYLEDADGKKAEFGAEPLKSGKNLNLSRLYVLTSSTTASASEAVINLLDPFMDVIVIGEVTEGKNVASEEFVSDDKVWEMHPITSKIFNSKGKSDYANGWIPDYQLGDVFNHVSIGTVVPIGGLLDLGNKEERLLKAALYHIVNDAFPETEKTRTTQEAGYPKGINSLSRKATNGVSYRPADTF